MFKRWFGHCCCAVLLLSSVAVSQAASATITREFENNTTEQVTWQLWQRYSGTDYNLASGTLNAGTAHSMAQTFTLGTGDTKIWYRWKYGTGGGSFTNWGKLGDGSTEWILVEGANGTKRFYALYEAPPPEYRFDMVLRNFTHTAQTYNAYTNGSLFMTQTLQVGGEWEFSWRHVTNIFPVTLDNNGAFPVLSASFSAEPGDYWKLEDTIVVPPFVDHVLNAGPAPTNSSPSLSNVFEGQPGGTNLATDGTLQKGFQVIYAQNYAQAEKANDNSSNVIAELRNIKNQLTNANATLSNLVANSTNRGVQAPTSGELGIAKGTGVSSNDVAGVANPFSDYSLGVEVGEYGLDSLETSVDWAFTLPFVGTIELNPSTNEYLGPMILPVRNLLIWASAIGVVLLSVGRVSEAMTAIGAAQQGRGASVTVAGTGTTWASAILAIAVIMGIVGVFALVWTNFKLDHADIFAFLGVDPMQYIPGVEELLFICPVHIMLGHFAIGLAFYILLTSAKFVAIMAIRAVPS